MSRGIIRERLAEAWAEIQKAHPQLRLFRQILAPVA